MACVWKTAWKPVEHSIPGFSLLRLTRSSIDFMRQYFTGVGRGEPAGVVPVNYARVPERRWSTASASCSSTATVVSQPIQASVTLCP